LAAEADCIITGDKDLLTLRKYKNIFISSPKDFWEFERNFIKDKFFKKSKIFFKNPL